METVFDLSGGALCLDFANTLGGRPTPTPNEHLQTYADLLAFARQERLLSTAQAQRLGEEAARRPAQAQGILARARGLRDGLYRIFAASVSGQPPEAGDLAALNAGLAEALGRLRLVSAARGFEWEWAAPESALDRMLWPILRSAADLLASERLASVRLCAAATCGWLFLDGSRNRTRKWCDMKVCGNRSKARRHYQRLKTGGSTVHSD